jgi:hypothetical protein
VDEETRMENEGSVMTFKEWMNKELSYTYKQTGPRALDYTDREIEVMREAWNAADRNAREECAAICDLNDGHTDCGRSVWRCAEEIRKTIKD